MKVWHERWSEAGSDHKTLNAQLPGSQTTQLNLEMNSNTHSAVFYKTKQFFFDELNLKEVSLELLHTTQDQQWHI